MIVNFLEPLQLPYDFQKLENAIEFGFGSKKQNLINIVMYLIYCQFSRVFICSYYPHFFYHTMRMVCARYSKRCSMLFYRNMWNSMDIFFYVWKSSFRGQLFSECVSISQKCGILPRNFSQNHRLNHEFVVVASLLSSVALFVPIQKISILFHMFVY